MDNSGQIAAIRKRLVTVLLKEMVAERISAAPTALGIFSDCIPSAHALG